MKNLKLSRWPDCLRGLTRIATFFLFLISLTMMATERQVIHNELKDAGGNILIESWQYHSGVRFYLQIPAAALMFTSTADGNFEARYAAELILYQAENIIATKSKITGFTLQAESETTSPDIHQYLTFDFARDSIENSHVEVIIRDLNNNHQAVLMAAVADTSQTDTAYFLSDILLARKAEVASTTGMIRSTVPNPDKRYGITEPNLYYYLEATVGDVDSISTLNVSLRGPGNLDSTIFTRNVTNIQKIPHFGQLDTGDLPPGEYLLISKFGSAVRNVVRQQTFVVEQSPTDLRFRAFEDVLAELALIASEDEMRELENSIPANRASLVGRFWDRRDPSEGTQVNEALLEFYRRVQLARELFWIGDSPDGRFNDKGQVFIVYGSPDRVVQQVTMVGRAREVWHYSHADVDAVFESISQTGDYLLLNRHSLLR